MKKRTIIAGSAALALILTACAADPGSGIPQETYDTLESSYESALEQQTVLESEKAALQEEYDAYKESMQAYEGLAAAEAEARRIEAEKVAESEAAAKAQAEAESQAQAEEEAKLGYETGITYDQLARTPDDYIGKKVKFSGKVVQTIEDDGEYQLRLAVDNDYDTVIYCAYEASAVSSRILEDDMITIYGTSAGLLSYKSTLGGTITIPSVLVEKIDQ